MAAEQQLEAKVVLLGDSGVGKTSIAVRYVQGLFAEDQPSTIGASFFTKRLVADDYKVKMQIWDTAGQERFRSMAPMYYRGSQGAVVMYDVTSEESFTGVEAWINELRESVHGSLVIAVVGNKCDIEPDKRVVQTERGKEFALSHQCLFFETSAKNDTGIVDLFQSVCQQIVKAHVATQASQPQRPAPQNQGIFIDDKANKPGSSKGGCTC